MSYGMLTNLFDRYTNNLGWLNIPFLLYTVALYTVKYIPFLSQYMLLCVVIMFVGFVVGGIIVMYLDYKYIFQSERHFQYNKLEFFDNNFSYLRQLLQAKKAARLAARVRLINSQLDIREPFSLG